MFWWIKPLLFSFAILVLIDGIICKFLTAVDAKSKIIKFFMSTLFALLSMICIFVVILIIHGIWIEYLPA